MTPEPELTMETDVSLMGWQAVCKGICTGGRWSQMERRNHINYLELLAAMFAVKSFAKDRREAHVHLRMDNRAAVFYVNLLGRGGTHSSVMSRLATQMWQWCLERNISLIAEHLTGTDNYIADKESRTFQTLAERQLHQEVFKQILETLGRYNIDLFATRLNAQLERFMSWMPDPNAIGTDGLQLPWGSWEGFAFPPFCFIGRCLRKVREDKAFWYLWLQCGGLSHGIRHY